MPLEIMTKGDVTISSPGMDNPITLTFGIGSVMKSEEFGKLVDQLLGKETSKLRELFKERAKEKGKSAKKAEPDQLALPGVVPATPENLALIQAEPVSDDAAFQNACDQFFGDESEPEQPDPRDIELAEAANIFGGKVIADSGSEMGVRGFGLLLQAALSARPDLTEAQLRAHLRQMLANDFQVAFDDVAGTLSGLSEDKYLNALGRIQKAKVKQ